MTDDDDDDDVRYRSRGDMARARKAEEKHLADLATALVASSQKTLAKLDLPETLVDALDEARRMKSHAARARQLRVVRRELPPPVADEATQWVNRFLEEGSAAIEAFLADHPTADRQHLNRLTRNAAHKDAKKAKKAKKTLVSEVREHLKLSAAADSSDDDG